MTIKMKKIKTLPYKKPILVSYIEVLVRSELGKLVSLCYVNYLGCPFAELTTRTKAK